MSVASCFWALLSLDNFEFIYLPDFITDIQIGYGKSPADILLSRSLLKFIHPDELSLARTDLMNFVKIKTLAGAVTRCRLKNVKSLVYQEYGDTAMNHEQDWIITDVVMYTATNKSVLTFFHGHEIIETAAVNKINTDNTTCCGSRQLEFNNSILRTLELYSTISKVSLRDKSIRIFQIYNTATKKLIISWPNSITIDDEKDTTFLNNALKLTNTLTTKEIDRKLEYSTINTNNSMESTCTHHCHTNSTLEIEPYGLYQIERIVITYGYLTFSSFQLNPLVINEDSKRYTHCSSSSLSSSPSISPVSLSSSTINQLKRKSNIADILNDNSVISSSLPPLAQLTQLPLQASLAQPSLSPSTFLSSSETNLTITNAPITTTSTEQQTLPPLYNSPSINNEIIPIKNTEKVINCDPPVNKTRSSLPKSWRGRFGAYEKKCENCQVLQSPEWRRGPSGHKTLCNACGLRYARLVAKQERQQPRKQDSLLSNLKSSYNVKE